MPLQPNTWKRQWRGRRIWYSLSHRPVRLQLKLNATSTMVPHTPPIIASPPVLMPDWETLSRLASTWSKLLDLNVCPMSSPSRPFWGQTGRNRHHQFWGQTRENRPISFEAKPLANRRPWFWGSVKKHALLISTCTVQTTQGVTRPLNHPSTEYPTCVTIFGPLHQVSYSCHDPRHCPPYRTYHLHITRQANTIL
jgi:hypothetical protein